MRFTIVDGFDGNDPSVVANAPYDPKLAQATISRQLSAGEIGCSMAHISIWQRVVRENIERCLILEDDALLSPEAAIQIEKALDSSANFDILNLISDADEVIDRGEVLSRSHHFTRFQGLANRLSAYVLTLSAAKKLLPVALPIRMEIDRLTGQRNFAGLEVLGIFPPVATLQAVRSEIWGNANNPPAAVVWNRKVRKPLNPKIAVLNPKLRRKSKKRVGSNIFRILRSARDILAPSRLGS